MRFVLRLAVAVAAATLLGVFLRELTLSDEDRVRGLVAEAESGWNDASAGRTVAPLADDFRLIQLRQDKSWIRSTLLLIYQQNRDPLSREFLFRAEVDWETVEIEFADAERTHARVRGRLHVVRTDDVAKFDYRGAFGAIARKRDGEWQLVSAVIEGLDRPRRPPRPPKPEPKPDPKPESKPARG